jgi:hypothetical protein
MGRSGSTIPPDGQSVAGDRYKLPFSAYLAILFKVHEMSLLGLHSAPFGQPVLGELVPSSPSSDRVSLSGILALLLGVEYFL